MSTHIEEDPDNLFPGVEIRNLKKVDISFNPIREGRCLSVDLLYMHIFLSGVYRLCAPNEGIYEELSPLCMWESTYC